MTADPRFWDRWAERYARSPVADESAYQEKLTRTRKYLTPDSRVLEFGCGTGSTAIAHAPHAGDILATDISEGMLRIARDKAKEARVDNVTFQRGALEDLDISKGSFDMVMGHSILHLVEDRTATIAEARHALKPGGIFVSSTACISEIAPWLRPFLPLGRLLGLLPMVRLFDEATLVAEIEAAGFEILERYRPKPKAAVFLIARKI